MPHTAFLRRPEKNHVSGYPLVLQQNNKKQTIHSIKSRLKDYIHSKPKQIVFLKTQLNSPPLYVERETSVD